MELNLNVLRDCLARGNGRDAWLRIAPMLMQLSSGEQQEIARTLAAGMRNDPSGIDPFVLEQFIGCMFLGCGLEQEGRASLTAVVRWKAAKARAEREFGLDFDDYPALYHFLGANDFRDYAQHIDSGKSQGAKHLLDEKTVGWLFHAQQMEKALPILKHFPDAGWLTLGDGRHAFEARFLMRHGARCFPTNLDPTLLQEARDMGLIGEYGVEDMEKLSFPDRSFDFICCKDSLHHSLRPYLALYEMLRVAGKGVFLIEPFDHSFAESPILGTRKFGWHHFEEGPGNYAYSFSERELEKLCVSHGWKCLATRGICCAHDDWVDMSSTQESDRQLYRARVEELERAASGGKSAWTSICSILLRDTPASVFRTDLEDAGFRITDLPVNPHLTRDVCKSLEQLYSRSDNPWPTPM